MSASLVTSTSPVAGVRLIALNRPDKRNAMSLSLIGHLVAALAAAEHDAAVRAIVLTGMGSFFSAGADLNDIAALDSGAARSCRYLENLCHGMAAVQKPIVAAVNGPALGGGFELALMCDLIVAAKSAYFALPETKRGLIPGAGGTQRLTAAVGKYRAMRTILLGRPISSDEALAWGLLCDLVHDQELMQQAIGVATSLAAQFPQATQMAKQAISRADGLCRDELFERNLYYASFGTAEKREGIDEFLTRRAK
ncbi:hypothetical protein CDD81_619 [Ophiocordyceps australis]|uniref:Enoyl-CoA hydratase n=1 Tax=Ophiocordyceps australis TaxID=1399860 RepID=A0A2C5YGI5_9HYPO|nr:hypothetical protein CDD81_619 [Ophiocordyceps australis]